MGFRLLWFLALAYAQSFEETNLLQLLTPSQELLSISAYGTDAAQNQLQGQGQGQGQAEGTEEAQKRPQHDYAEIERLGFTSADDKWSNAPMPQEPAKPVEVIVTGQHIVKGSGHKKSVSGKDSPAPKSKEVKAKAKAKATAASQSKKKKQVKKEREQAKAQVTQKAKAKDVPAASGVAGVDSEASTQTAQGSDAEAGSSALPAAAESPKTVPTLPPTDKESCGSWLKDCRNNFNVDACMSYKSLCAADAAKDALKGLAGPPAPEASEISSPADALKEALNDPSVGTSEVPGSDGAGAAAGAEAAPSPFGLPDQETPTELPADAGAVPDIKEDAEEPEAEEEAAEAAQEAEPEVAEPAEEEAESTEVAEPAAEEAEPVVIAEPAVEEAAERAAEEAESSEAAEPAAADEEAEPSEVAEPAEEEAEPTEVAEPVAEEAESGEAEEAEPEVAEPAAEEAESTAVAEPAAEEAESSEVAEPAVEEAEPSDAAETVTEEAESTEVEEPAAEEAEPTEIAEPVAEEAEPAAAAEPSQEAESSEVVEPAASEAAEAVPTEASDASGTVSQPFGFTVAHHSTTSSSKRSAKAVASKTLSSTTAKKSTKKSTKSVKSKRKSTTSTKSLTSKTSKSKKLVTAKTHSKSNEGSSEFVLPQAATAVTNHQEVGVPSTTFELSRLDALGAGAGTLGLAQKQGDPQDFETARSNMCSWWLQVCGKVAKASVCDKLARLIQHQHQALAHESVGEVVRRSGSRPSSHRGEASPSSSRSGFSGFSSNSAPARLPGPSPQVRLKDYCDSVERLSKANDRRPRLPSGSSTGSTRPYSSSSRGSDRGLGLESCSSTSSVGNAAAKRAAGGARKAAGKPPKAASFEEQRRARIRHMQRLYGLGHAKEAETQPTIVEPQNSQRGGEPTAVEASPVQRQPRQPRFHRCPTLSGLDFILGLGGGCDSQVVSLNVAARESSWCPFCTKVNVAFQSMGVSDLKVVEADHRPDELDFMEAVKEITEKKSVPQVFVGGKFIPGGCDNIMDLREKGELKPLLQEAAVTTVLHRLGKKMASGERLSCEYFRGSGQHQAFVFYRSESNGSHIEVQPAAAGGLCYYPEANCELTEFSCCTVTSTVSKEADRCQLHNTIYCLAAIILAFQLPGMCRRLGFFTSSTASEEEAAEEASESQDQEDSEDDEPESTDSGVCVRRVLRILACLAIMAFIAAEVYCAILIANATQRALTVPERNSMLAADAFLVPLVEIFQFLEDVVAVKISAAMVTGETHLVRHILIMGVVGGILCGTVAASIATAICSWPAAIQWILAPYSMHDSYLQCPLVPQGPAAADSARMYWLLQVWSWPLGFACRAIKGFLFGSGDIVLGMTVLGLANGMVSIGGIYLFFLPQPSLDSLGWISFACSGASFLILLAMFAARRDLRQRYGLRITRPRSTTCSPVDMESHDDNDSEQSMSTAAATLRHIEYVVMTLDHMSEQISDIRGPWKQGGFANLLMATEAGLWDCTDGRMAR
eukprot:s1446_g10.t1